MKIKKGKIYELDPKKRYIIIVPDMGAQDAGNLSQCLNKLARGEDANSLLLVGEQFFDMSVIENAERIEVINEA